MCDFVRRFADERLRAHLYFLCFPTADPCRRIAGTGTTIISYVSLTTVIHLRRTHVELAMIARVPLSIC